MYPLLPSQLRHRLASPASARAAAEDRYYQAYVPTNRNLLPLVRLAGLVGFVALLADLWPR